MNVDLDTLKHQQQQQQTRAAPPMSEEETAAADAAAAASAIAELKAEKKQQAFANLLTNLNKLGGEAVSKAPYDTTTQRRADNYINSYLSLSNDNLLDSSTNSMSSLARAAHLLAEKKRKQMRNARKAAEQAPESRRSSPNPTGKQPRRTFRSEIKDGNKVTEILTLD